MNQYLRPKNPCKYAEITIPKICPNRSHGNNSKKSITYFIFVGSCRCCANIIRNGINDIRNAIVSATAKNESIFFPVSIRFSPHKSIRYITFKFSLWVLLVRLLLIDLASLSIFSKRTRTHKRGHNYLKKLQIQIMGSKNDKKI